MQLYYTNQKACFTFKDKLDLILIRAKVKTKCGKYLTLMVVTSVCLSEYYIKPSMRKIRFCVQYSLFLNELTIRYVQFIQ